MKIQMAYEDQYKDQTDLTNYDQDDDQGDDHDPLPGPAPVLTVRPILLLVLLQLPGSQSCLLVDSEVPQTLL